MKGISSRLSRSMGDHVVSAEGERLRRAKSWGPEQSDDPMRERFGRLAWAAFDAQRIALQGAARDSVVDPSVPVLYFGDHDAYFSSPLRIVTVGLNPSKAEFPGVDPFKRFPLAAGINWRHDDYLAALDTYFKTDPYSGWFSSYESLLNGLDASYYPGARHTALHTDLCSPLATDPTWAGLEPAVRDALTSHGLILWHELVTLLRPDVVIVSIAKAHLDKIEFTSSDPFEISRLEDEGRRRPFVTEGRWLDIDGHRSLLVFGQAAQRPFGHVSHMHKLGIGGRIAAHLRRSSRPAPVEASVIAGM